MGEWADSMLLWKLFKMPESFCGSAVWKMRRFCQKTSHQDLVTRWDRKIEQLLRNEILTAFPQDSIVGEEYPPEAHRTGSVTWYIDPIDGTTNFINQHQKLRHLRGVLGREVPRCSAWCWTWKRETLYWAKRGGGAWQNQTPIHTSGRRELSELLLTTPGLQYTFLEPHPTKSG